MELFKMKQIMIPTIKSIPNNGSLLGIVVDNIINQRYNFECTHINQICDTLTQLRLNDSYSFKFLSKERKIKEIYTKISKLEDDYSNLCCYYSDERDREKRAIIQALINLNGMIIHSLKLSLRKLNNVN